jgi:hypothetical protein
MITKQTNVDQITVTESGIVLYREVTRVIEDGKEIAKTYHRTSLTPGQDIAGQPEKVIAVCNAAWSPEIIAAYQAAQEAAAQRIGG